MHVKQSPGLKKVEMPETVVPECLLEAGSKPPIDQHIKIFTAEITW